MTRLGAACLGIASLVLALCTYARAENGARLFGVGATSRSMGGTGIAFPQEAIAALTSNPAALAFRPRADETEIGFAGTVIFAKTDAEVILDGEKFKGSDRNVIPISTIALAMPAPGSGDVPRWFGGFSIFALGGFGVDYRDTSLDQPAFYDLGGGQRAPLIVGEFSSFQALSASPALAFRPLDWVSVGLQGSLTASTLDLRRGSSVGYSFGGQVGLSLRPHDRVLVGATYLTSQRTRFANVIDLDGDRSADTVKLEVPQQVGLGIAFEPAKDLFLVEVDVKWLDWDGAKGFEDNDWDDQWVVAFGAQVRPLEGLAFRLGYNYGRSPVERHRHFVGTDVVPAGGATGPAYYHETGRTIGNPAIARHHLTIGLGYEFSQRTTVHAGLVHVLGPEVLRERGTDLLGRPVTIQTRGVYADTVEFGLTLRF